MWAGETLRVKAQEMSQLPKCQLSLPQLLPPPVSWGLQAARRLIVPDTASCPVVGLGVGAFQVGAGALIRQPWLSGAGVGSGALLAGFVT